MSAMKPKAGVEESDMPAVHRIRITLTSRNVKNLEKVRACGRAAAAALRRRSSPRRP
jgi:hypothetical protein